ncbi:MAG: SpoIVB peptidase S55 domain-containing protein, partial [candidate division WOR-3 bacterium]
MSTYRVAITVLFLVSFAFPKISILPVDSIRPGMKGIGRSVFSGTKVEEFEVEVLDVMRNVSPHRDIILCRLSGAGLEKTGVIAGMSGSPVYINNKLAGAVASTWSFAKEPVAGVTPAKEMLDIWDRERDSSTRQSLPRAHRKGFLHFSRNDGARGLGWKEKIKTGKGGLGEAEWGMTHLPLPLTISGFNPAIKEIAQPILAQYNLTLVGATGSAPNTLDTANLIPGGAVGVGLIDGDVRLAAVGTITHREGNRILAFGHPLFLAGDVALPMTGGVIHSVLPSMELSFKIFSPSPPIGVITQDRESGVSGLIGPLPPMVPISVAVTLSGER